MCIYIYIYIYIHIYIVKFNNTGQLSVFWYSGYNFIVPAACC